MTINITLPIWLTICFGVLILFEKIIHLIHNKYTQNTLHRICVALFYHNDEEFYKAQVAEKKARQALCRHNHQNGNGYKTASRQDMLDKKRDK